MQYWFTHWFAVLHSGGLHHCSGGWVPATAQEQERDFHCMCLHCVLRHWAVQYHTGTSDLNKADEAMMRLCTAAGTYITHLCFSCVRVACMCLNSSTITQPAGCVCSSWCSLSVSQSPGAMVSHFCILLLCVCILHCAHPLHCIAL